MEELEMTRELSEGKEDRSQEKGQGYQSVLRPHYVWML